MLKLSRLYQVKRRSLSIGATLFAISFLVYYNFIYDDFDFEFYKCKDVKIKVEPPMSNNLEFTGSGHFIEICQNKVESKHRIAIWSLLSDDCAKYTVGAVKLLKSIATNVQQTHFDAIILELTHKPIEDDYKAELLKAGWKICQVERIAPPNERETLKRFRDQFTKLLLWRVVQYEANYYFDADTFAIRNLDDFFKTHMRLDETDHRIGCGQDFRDESWVDTFNMGVFIVKPNLSEYQRLIQLKDNPDFKYEAIMSEQGFLNEVYKNKWLDIGFKNNANLALFAYLPTYWHKHELSINIIHFTMSKPWSCTRRYKAICELWTNLNHCNS